jgi:hypothetical protein
VTEFEEIMRVVELGDKYGMRFGCPWDGISALWCRGNDTLEIASITGKSEAEVYNHLTMSNGDRANG